MGDLTKHFSLGEFACQCGCGYVKACEILVEKLEVTREKFGPIHINSGSRCEDHNLKMGGRPNSSHLLGWAVDIDCRNSFDRFFLVKLLLEAGFTRIGIGETFIHADMDPGKPENLLWLYPANQ